MPRPKDQLYGIEVVLPFHGQYLDVRNCIENILHITRGCPYRIFLVDDGSKNKDFLKEMKKLSNVVEGVRSEEHGGFGAALNLAINKTVLPFLCFVHSDVIITNGKWLLELYNTYLKLRKQRVGLVCAMSDKPPNMCEALLRGVGEVKPDTIATEALPIFCALCERTLFEKVGLFKEYPLGFYEDTEFFFRLQKHKFSEAVCGLSWVKHGGGKTVQRLWEEQPETKQIMTETNRERCLTDVKKLFAK